MARDTSVNDQDNSEEDDDDDVLVSGDGTRTLKFNASVTAEKSSTGEARKVELTYTVPASINGWVEKFGEAVVQSMLDAQITSRLRAITRPAVEGEEVKAEDGTVTNKTYTDEEIQAIATAYIPSATRGRKGVSKGQKAIDAVETMTKEEQDALIERMKALGLV